MIDWQTARTVRKKHHRECREVGAVEKGRRCEQGEGKNSGVGGAGKDAAFQGAAAGTPTNLGRQESQSEK